MIYQGNRNIGHVVTASASCGRSGTNGSSGSYGQGGYRGNHKVGIWCEWDKSWGCSTWGRSSSDRTVSCYDRASSGNSGGINYSRSNPTETETAFRQKVETVKYDFAQQLIEFSNNNTELSFKVQFPFLKEFNENGVLLSGNL